MLTIMGTETRSASDGIEALEVAATFQPDLIFLDIGMPRMNGYETACRLRQLPWGKNVVLIALTGWGQEDDRRNPKKRDLISISSSRSSPRHWKGS